jgi:hypothetical protein
MPNFDILKKYQKQVRKVEFKNIIIIRLNLDTSFLL